jgi:hypothetical protein
MEETTGRGKATEIDIGQVADARLPGGSVSKDELRLHGGSECESAKDDGQEWQEQQS